MQATVANRERLKIIRDLVTRKLTSIAPLIDKFDCEMDFLRSEGNETTTEIFVKRMKSVSKKCNRQMVQYTGDIIRQVTEICGPPPCRCAAVGLGSIAREETTPYSDLEFLFLVENNNLLVYFRCLAVTVYFIIGNLQETDLKYMNIEELNRDGKWFSDASVSGFKIDGLQKKAGNIPTGNGTERQQDKFIKTVSEMAEMYRQVFLYPDGEESKIGDLTAMLSSTVLLYGDRRMYDQFVSQISSVKPSESRTAASKVMMRSDIGKFHYEPDETMTHIKSLKMDFYRFPSLMTLDLKILHNIIGTSVWETLDTLLKHNFLSQTVWHSLRVILSISIFTRLSAYSHHSSQDDRMTVIEQIELSKTSPWPFPRKLLIHYFLHSTPLKMWEARGKIGIG